MQTNKPFDTNPYIAQNTQSVDNMNNADLGLQNTNPYINNTTTNNLLGSFDTKQFLVGALVGVAGAYLLTNEKAQKAIFKTVAKGGAMFSAGLEEMKERFEDAQAELEAEQNG
jgi:hypothetical protein